MQELEKKLNELLNECDKNAVEQIMHSEFIAPFEKVNRIIAYLLATGKMNYADYSRLANEYIARHDQQNKYLYLFDMAPRTFGQSWAEEHIRKLFPEFMKATNENLCRQYPKFDGEFDLWINGIRVEVKACRANSTKGKGSLSSRAYTHEEAMQANFKYHYQQLKPSCCDVFIWIGVCRDELIYWVLTSDELRATGKLGSQHRNENTGIVGAEVFEGQVFMTEKELLPFHVAAADILKVVQAKGRNIGI